MPELGRYSLLRRIGVGGMAEVWKARIQGAAGFAKTVAIKRVLMEHAAESALFDQLFIQEAMLAAELSHPNIVAVHDFGQTEQGEYFIAMEFVSGRNLSVILHRMEERGVRMSLEWALYITAEACRGLGYAHAMRDDAGKPLQIIHRDVSPQNILVSWHGDVKLTDFGIAKAASSLGVNETGRVLGKIAYMSPEHARGEKLDHRSDLFGLGLVLYEQLAGRKLFQGSPQELFAQVALFAGLRPEQLAKVPEAAHAVIQKALAPDPDARFRNATDMEAALLSPLSAGAVVDVRRIMSTVIRNYFAPEIEAEATGDQAVSAAQVPSFATLAPRQDATVASASRMPIIATPPPSFLPPPAVDPFFGTPTPPPGTPLPWAAQVAALDEFLGISAPVLTAMITPLEDEPLVVGVPRFRPAAERWKQTQRVLSLAAAARAPLAVSADGDFIRVWDLTRRREVASLKGHRSAVTGVAITGDGSIALSTGRDGNVRVWELSSGKTLHVLDHNPGPTVCVSVSDDGWLAVSGAADGRVSVWDLVTTKPAPKMTGHGEAVNAIALVGTERALSGAEDGTLFLWDLESRQAVAQTRLGGGVRSIAVAPDRRQALVGVATGGLLLFDLEPLQARAELRQAGPAQAVVAFAPDGARAVSGDSDGLVHLWDMSSGTARSAFELHDAGISGLAFLEGSERLLSASEDRTLAIWTPQ